MRRDRRGYGQVAAMAGALALALPLMVLSLEAELAGRRALMRSEAWHLARGFAVEFARPGVSGGRHLRGESVSDLQFVDKLIRRHGQIGRRLGRYRVFVTRRADRADVRIEWSEGTRTRVMAEHGSRSGP